MNMQSTLQAPSRGGLGRSIFAMFAGIVVGILLSMGTDLGLHAIGWAPSLSQMWPNHLLVLAATYRAIYGIISAYVIARLAPNRPMGHALLAGALGLVVSTVGAVATWNSTAGQHWYTVVLPLTALPTAWLGGKLRLLRIQTETTAG